MFSLSSDSCTGLYSTYERVSSYSAFDSADSTHIKLSGNLTSTNKSSSASIGGSVGSSSMAVNASLSKGKGSSNGHDISWTETVIQGGNHAGDKTTLASGTDTNLIGAQVRGNQVIADVGTTGQGNLSIQSLQDTSHYSNKQQNIGGSLSVGYGQLGGSLSFSNSRTNSDYASVKEQSSILAGDGGFQVNVANNTNLTGAVIASTEQAIQDNKNSLNTQTLTSSNLQNKAEYEAKAVSVSVGGGMQSGKPTLTGAAGYGSDSGKADSVTLSGISQGTVTINDDSKQQTLTGKDTLTTVALLNHDVRVDESGNAVDSEGKSTAANIAPIFDQEKVAREIQAQVEITKAFSEQQQEFRINLNKKVDTAKAEKDAVADMLKNQDLTDDQRIGLIARGMSAQKEIEQLENVAIVFSAIGGGLSAPTNSIGGIVANSLAPVAANQIGQYFKDHGTEGTAPQILAHGVLASAVAALGGNNPMGAALSAMSGELVAPLVAELLYGKPSEELNAEQKATVSTIASLGGVAASAGIDSSASNLAQSSLAAQNAVDNNWGVVGHYSTMATVLYLAGFSTKDAKAVALAAWAPDTDQRNAMSTNSALGSLGSTNNSQSIHLLDGEDDPVKVIASQQKLAGQVKEILSVIKQYENDPAKKAAYLTTPSVQNTLHAFGDAFAHVVTDGTHYPIIAGHATEGTTPDNPATHADAYKNYVNTLFNVASQITASRVSTTTISNLVNNVTASSNESDQTASLKNSMESLSTSISSSLVNSPVSDCGWGTGCSNKPIGSQVNPEINSIYGRK